MGCTSNVKFLDVAIVDDITCGRNCPTTWGGNGGANSDGGNSRIINFQGISSTTAIEGIIS
ncbi:MAG: hypothetical protein ACK5RY_08505 [Dolichospermum sp.]